jgi:hypothetical protein
MASIKFPLASMDLSPIDFPHILMAYEAKASWLHVRITFVNTMVTKLTSEEDSSSFPSADSKRPFAQLWPWYQSKERLLNVSAILVNMKTSLTYDSGA